MSTLRPSAPTAAARVRSSVGSRTVLAGLLAGVLPLTAACGASRDPQTYQERSQADATNTALGTLAIRGLAVLPPEDDDRTYEEGSDAEVTVVVSTNDDESDVLEEVSSPVAESVEVLVDGEPGTLEVPPLGSTGNSVTLRLVGLTEDVREGEYVMMTLRFRDNGSIEVPVPVAVSGRTDRPVYTAPEGEEHEPALQAPAGGHHGSESEEGAEDGEPGEGDLAEAELGQDTDEESPRESRANEPSESATDESEAPS